MRFSAVALVSSVAIAIGALACSSLNPRTEPPEVRPTPTELAPRASRCRMYEPQHPFAPDDPGGVIAVAGARAGVRYFAPEHWWDDTDHGDRVFAPDTVVAFTGASYVVANRRTLTLFTPAFGPGRALRSLPANACSLHLVEMNNAVAMLYIRAAGDCSSRTAYGPVMFQRLDVNGAAAGPAVQLGRGDAARERIGLLRARWDSGRIVLDFRDEEEQPHFAVLAPDGRELAQGDGGDVVCPRAGCVRLIGRASTRPGGPGEDPTSLRVEIIGRGATFNLPLQADGVIDSATRGDRTLIRYGTRDGGTSEEDDSNFAIIDVARREVVSVFDEVRHAPVTQWREVGADSNTRIAASSTGFVIGGGDRTHGTLLRRIECMR